MPPWHADPKVGHFAGERRMPKTDRDTIAEWIEGGLALGDANDLPKLPDWPEGWHLQSEPDTVFAMRERPFPVPADGTVEYQYFVVDPGWERDTWIRAAQVIPGDASVVHHCIVFVRPPDGTGFAGIGWLGAYVPGQRTIVLPPGHARLIPARSKLVFQMHYTPNGRETDDLSRVGVWLADEDSVTHEVTTQVAIESEFEIPPRAKDFVVRMSETSFPPESRLLGITPHMHLRGQSFRLMAKRSDGSERPLLSVPAYDFNWQHWYSFAEPVDLSKISSLEMEVVFDNSTKNPVNPQPDDYVSWGDQTWEEMAVAFYDVARPLSAPYRRIEPEYSEEKKQRWRERVEHHVDKFMDDMDRNHDGLVRREEVPNAFRRYGFRRMDGNSDGVLDRQEIEKVVGYRTLEELQ